MKFKHLLVAAFAAVAMAFTSCEKEEDLGPAQVTVNPTSLSFEATASSQSVSLKATRAWTATAPEWIALSATSGDASSSEKTISVTVEDNTGNNRTGEVVFNIGLAKATLTIVQAGPGGEIQAGDGSKDNPFSVAGVVAYVNELGADVNSPEKVYVKGKVSSVKEAFSKDYGNGTFTISDDGSAEGDQFTCYRIYYLGNKKWVEGNDQIAVGDDVIIYGNVVNYKGNTPETQQNSAFLYSLNGKSDGGDTPSTGGEAKGSGTLEDPYNPAGAAAYAQSLGSDVQSDKSVYIKGKISSIGSTFAASGTYGNATFNIVDATDGTGDFYVFQTYYLGGRKWATGDTDVQEGDEVIICGPVVNYRGNTPETVGKGASYIYSLNGVTDGGNGGDTDYQNAAAKTVADFIATADTGTYYKLTGTVSNFNATYCSFDLTDATGSIYVYSVDNKGDWSSKVTNGSTVTLAGKYAYYAAKEQHEVVNAYILSCEGGETPDYENATAKTVAEFIAAADTDTYYKLTGTVSNFNSSYCSFDLTDETGSIYVYSVINKSEWSSKVANGATVVLAGQYAYYAAKEQHEVVNAYILSSEGGETPQPGEEGEYTSTVSWTLGSNAYDNVNSTVNGVAGVKTLKLGTGSKYGDATLTIPSGATTLTFYAVSWNNADVASLKFTVGGEEIDTVTPASNSGLKGNSTYELTVTDSDKFEISVTGGTELKVETTGGYRAALFGIKAN